MTRKKERKEVSLEGDEEDTPSGTETEKTEPELIENKKEPEPELIDKKPEEPVLLEYFSKEELVEKVNEMEFIIKGYEEKIVEFKSWKTKYMNLQAEFENAQKRWDKSRQSLRKQESASILRSFLPLYDSFKKAVESEKDNDTIKQFFNQFLGILKSKGVEPIPTKCKDPFDYNLHEALTTIEKEDFEENTVCDIIQDGWKLDKDVLRYAKVVISKKPKPPEPEKEIESESNNNNTEEVKDKSENISDSDKTN